MMKSMIPRTGVFCCLWVLLVAAAPGHCGGVEGEYFVAEDLSEAAGIPVVLTDVDIDVTASCCLNQMVVYTGTTPGMLTLKDSGWKVGDDIEFVAAPGTPGVTILGTPSIEMYYAGTLVPNLTVSEGDPVLEFRVVHTGAKVHFVNR